ncbi:hypothetical protein ACFY05_32280 [Microtetraspora fusca]|uniref:DUF4192 family protein n=1 Tax=Microtetraspora fusca TaxID=1997 RepID=A0ABW6VDV9_MICFU
MNLEHITSLVGEAVAGREVGIAELAAVDRVGPGGLRLVLSDGSTYRVVINQTMEADRDRPVVAGLEHLFWLEGNSLVCCPLSSDWQPDTAASRACRDGDPEPFEDLLVIKSFLMRLVRTGRPPVLGPFVICRSLLYWLDDQGLLAAVPVGFDGTVSPSLHAIALPEKEYTDQLRRIAEMLRRSPYWPPMAPGDVDDPF